MNEIKIFNSPQFGEIRTISVNEEPLFAASDVCKVLGYSNPSKAISDHTDDDERYNESLERGGTLLFVNESGLFSLVLRSNKPEAKPFRKWVTSEVLPAIRKTGGYIVAKEEDTPDIIMARGMVAAMDAIERLKKDNAEKERKLTQAQKQLEYQAPVIKYANDVLSSTTGHITTTIASELNMSAITLNKLLCKAHFLRKVGKKGEYSLSAAHQGRGYVVTNTKKYERPDESIGSRIEIQYTEMGRMKIHEITGRAIAAGVLEERKGRYFINHSWVPAEKQA